MTESGLILFLVIVLAFSWLMTNRLCDLAWRHNIIDVPNARSSHTHPTPRGGGLAIVVPFQAMITFFWAVDFIDSPIFAALFGGGGLIGAVGYWDDHRPVEVRWKLLAHVAAAVWAVWWLGCVPALDLGQFKWEWGVVGQACSVLSFVWIINLYNFMDGIDGIAGSEGVFMALFGGTLLSVSGAPGLAWTAWTLAAATGGFLLWNWPPARIFMGDVGSCFLGYTIATLALAGAIRADCSPFLWLILFGTFAVDATVTLTRRVLRGAKVHEAHRSHAYQHAAKRWGHLRVTIAIVVIDLIWLAPCAYLVFWWPKTVGTMTLIATSPLIALALYLNAGGEACGVNDSSLAAPVGNPPATEVRQSLR